MHFSVWGVTGTLATADPAAMEFAEQRLWHWIDAIDQSCNRFRADSEISRVNATAGETVALSPVLELALDAALRSSEMTGGLCDPTVLPALVALGYDRDYDQITEAARTDAPPRPLGASAVHLDRAHHALLLERGAGLDLGASAKALAADLVADDLAARTGVLVEIGGDVAVRGAGPDGPWVIGVSDRLDVDAFSPRIALAYGGVATSSTATRTWRAGEATINHIIDPRTGRAAEGPYATVTVSAADCVTANAFSTAGLLWGEDAGYHIAQAGWSARLVRHDGTVEYVGGWPDDTEGRS